MVIYSNCLLLMLPKKRQTRGVSAKASYPLTKTPTSHWKEERPDQVDGDAHIKSSVCRKYSGLSMTMRVGATGEAGDTPLKC